MTAVPAGGPAPDRGRTRSLPNVALALAALWVIATTLSATVGYIHPLPFQDQWAFVIDYRDWLAGDYGIERLWAQHNEHRIPFARLFFFADLHWFGGRNVFLAVATLAIQAVHALVLVVLVRAAGAARPDRVTAAAMVALALAAALQINCFIWGFCLHYALALTAPTVAFVSLVAAAAARGFARGAAVVAGIAAATVGAASMASGMLVWPLLLSLAAALRLGPRVLIPILVAAAGFGSAYFAGLEMHGGPLARDLEHSRNLLLFPICLLGNPLAKFGKHAAAALGAGGVLLAASMAVGMVRSRSRGADPRAAHWALLHAVLFFGGTAAAIGIGRAYAPLNRALSSRYTMIGLAFWAALLALWIVRWSSRDERSRWRRAPVVGCGLLALALVGQQIEAAGQFRVRLVEQRLTTAALLGGVVDPPVFDDLIPDWGLDLVPVLRRNDLSIFARGEAELLGRRLLEHLRPAGATPGAILRREPLAGGGGGGWRVHGWLEPPPGASHRLYLCGADGTVLGFAAVTARGPTRSVWSGYVAAAETTALHPFVLLGEDRVAPLQTSEEPRGGR